MSCESKKGQVITTGGILKKPSGENLTLSQALDELAKCCGFSCCEKLIRIPDQTTGETAELFFDGGDLKYTIGGTTYVVTVTAEGV